MYIQLLSFALIYNISTLLVINKDQNQIIAITFLIYKFKQTYYKIYK